MLIVAVEVGVARQGRPVWRGPRAAGTVEPAAAMPGVGNTGNTGNTGTRVDTRGAAAGTGGMLIGGCGVAAVLN